jgi:hypothetical protein
MEDGQQSVGHFLTHLKNGHLRCFVFLVVRNTEEMSAQPA